MVSPIETLPEEILLDIFDYLDGKSLKNSALVCKTWNDVTNLSSKMTKDFRLTLCEDTNWMERIDEIKNLSRKFQFISVTLRATDNCKAILLLTEVLLTHGAHIKRFVLTQADFNDAYDFCKILKTMPLLAELEVQRLGFRRIGHFSHELSLELKQFTTLIVNTCDWDMFHYFISSPIRYLKVSNRFKIVHNTQVNTFMRFLKASNKLESIEFDLMTFAKIFRTPLSNEFLFKLKKFKILLFSPDYEIGKVSEIFETFLESHASSLKELELNYVLPSLIQIIFSKLTVLEKLRLNSVSLPTNEEFYNPFATMGLKEITFHDTITSEIAVKRILANCPDLETLKAKHDSAKYIPDLFPFITVYNTKIKDLYMDTLTPAAVSDHKLNHLKFLHIENCINFEILVSFVCNHSTIETLSLKLDEAEIPKSTLISFLNHPSLHSLRIMAGNTLDAIYNKIDRRWVPQHISYICIE